MHYMGQQHHYQTFYRNIKYVVREIRNIIRYLITSNNDLAKNVVHFSQVLLMARKAPESDSLVTRGTVSIFHLQSFGYQYDEVTPIPSTLVEQMNEE